MKMTREVNGRSGMGLRQPQVFTARHMVNVATANRPKLDQVPVIQSVGYTS
jgi:hypothetical protein